MYKRQVLYRTSLGYRIRVTGLNQDAAAMSGIKPGRMCMTAFFISGAIAGLAGFTEINGMQPVSYTHLDVYKRQGINRRF